MEKFIADFLWGIGLRIFTAGLVALKISVWSDWTFFIAGFIILIFTTIYKAKSK